MKAIENEREIQIKGLENRVEKNFFRHRSKSVAPLFSKDFLYGEAICELSKIVEMENKFDRNNLIYKTGNNKKDKTFDFQNFKTIRSSRREIYNNYLSLDDAIEQQIRLKYDIDIFKESAKQKECKNANVSLNGR